MTAKSRMKPRELLRIEIPLVDHCNLNCYMCANYSPISEKSFLDIDSFKNDLQQLSILTGGKLEEIFFHGGEPLLHPQIADFLAIARSYFRTAKITILTNGILLPKETSDFWMSCKRNAVTIKITRYPIKLDVNEIKQQAGKYNVEVGYFGGSSVPIKSFWKLPLDRTGNQNPRKSFILCHSANHCINLRDGKLYPCTRIAFINYFNNYFNEHFEITNTDYIDLYKINNYKEISDFMCNPVPFCRYCNNKNITTGIKWQISEKQIFEWL